VVKTRGVEHGTVTHLGKIGVLGDNLLAAHSVWVSPDEVPVFQPLDSPSRLWLSMVSGPGPVVMNVWARGWWRAGTTDVSP
jgi:cytosine/adenosine deaminase-related metal-dependent hydrolase